MPVSRANGLDIYYEIAGSGPPLVLIHALPFDHNLWALPGRAVFRALSHAGDGPARLGQVRQSAHALHTCRYGE